MGPEFIMHTDMGQNPREYRMLKGGFRETAQNERGVLISDLNGVNMANIIHLNLLIFLVDKTELEAVHSAYLGSCAYIHREGFSIFF